MAVSILRAFKAQFLTSPTSALSQAIWILPIVALLIIGCTFSWFTYNEYNQAIEREFRALESNDRIALALVTGLMRNLEQFLDNIADEQKTLSAKERESYDAELVARKTHFPEVRSLVVINAKGRVEYSANPKLKGFDSSERDYFVAHLGKPLEHNFYVSRPFKTATGNDMSIAFSVAIYDGDRKFQGMVVSGLDPAYFESVLSQVRPQGEGTTASLFNSHGDFICRIPNRDASREDGDGANEVMRAHFESQKSMTRQIGMSRIDGVKKLFVISSVGNTGIYVGISRNFDDVLIEWKKTVFIEFIIFIITAVILFSLSSIASRRERERKTADDAFRVQAIRLTAINAELERFAYIAAHDLREPVRLVSNYLTLIEKSLGDGLSEVTRKYIRFAVTGAKRMDQMIHDLLDYSRIGDTTDKFRMVALREVIDRSLLELSITIAESKARVVVAAGMPEVRGIESELTRLFQNLLGNAIKYRHAERKPEIAIGCREEGSDWVIWVRDNGMGIDPQYREQVFAVFHRLVPKDLYDGTGIGLAVCRRIVEHHGGRIWIEDAPGGGCTFLMTLPRSAASSQCPE